MALCPSSPPSPPFFFFFFSERREERGLATFLFLTSLLSLFPSFEPRGHREGKEWRRFFPSSLFFFLPLFPRSRSARFCPSRVSSSLLPQGAEKKKPIVAFLLLFSLCGSFPSLDRDENCSRLGSEVPFFPFLPLSFPSPLFPLKSVMRAETRHSNFSLSLLLPAFLSFLSLVLFIKKNILFGCPPPLFSPSPPPFSPFRGALKRRTAEKTTFFFPSFFLFLLHWGRC